MKTEWLKQEESGNTYGAKGGFIMFKRKIITLSAIMIAGLMTFQANVLADAVEEKPYLSLGADLSTDQKSKVLELLDVDESTRSV